MSIYKKHVDHRVKYESTVQRMAGKVNAFVTVIEAHDSVKTLFVAGKRLVTFNS